MLMGDAEKPAPEPDPEIKKIDTDDLQTELAAREAKKEKRSNRGWKLAIAGALGTAITAWIPNISNLIDAKAESIRRTAVVDQLLKERVANEEGYKKLASTINEHADSLKQLQTCLIDVAVLKEWQRSTDARLERRLNIKLPDPIPASAGLALDINEKPATKVSTKRPHPEEDNPRLQQLKEELPETLK